MTQVEESRIILPLTSLGLDLFAGLRTKGVPVEDIENWLDHCQNRELFSQVKQDIEGVVEKRLIEDRED